MQLATIAPHAHNFLKRIDNTNTRNSFERSIQDFAQYLVNTWDVRSINGVTVEIFDAYKTELAAKYKANTVNVKMSGVRKFFEYLFHKGIVTHSEFKLAKGVKLNRGETRQPCPHFNDVEAALHRLPQETTTDVQTYLTMFILANTGLRREELVNLKLSDLSYDDNNGYIRVRNGKGGKARILPIHLDVLRRIEECTQNSGEYLLRSASNNSTSGKKPLALKNVNERIAKVGAKFGFDNFTPHGMRRYFASKLYSLGVGIETISLRLGHTNTQTTREYLTEEIQATMHQNEIGFSIGV